MTRADYYILPDSDPDSRERFLGRICEKALAHNHRVYIHLPDDNALERLDARLWSFRADAFVPHVILGKTPEAPVEIGFGEQRPRHRELFVNMALDLPEDAFEFERIVEIVVQEAEILAATRQNYQRCRERGIELHRTDLR